VEFYLNEDLGTEDSLLPRVEDSCMLGTRLECEFLVEILGSFYAGFSSMLV
jgi:hypothetical protein